MLRQLQCILLQLATQFWFNPFIYKYSCEACNTLENKYEYQLHIEGVAMCLGKCTEIVSLAPHCVCAICSCVFTSPSSSSTAVAHFHRLVPSATMQPAFCSFQFSISTFSPQFLASLSVFHLTFELRFVRGIAAR